MPFENKNPRFNQNRPKRDGSFQNRTEGGQGQNSTSSRPQKDSKNAFEHRRDRDSARDNDRARGTDRAQGTDRDRNRERDSEDNPPMEGLIIGRNPVMEALKSGAKLDTIYLGDEPKNGSLPHIAAMAKEHGAVIKVVGNQKLDRMSFGRSHQGIIAMGAYAEYKTIEELLEVSKAKGTPPFLLICDELEDPHNLGAVLRTAEAAGMDGVIIPKHRSATINTTVYKTSAGAAAWVPVARVTNIPAAIDQLKKAGIWIYGSDAEGKDYQSVSITGPAALVVGSEGSGISRLVKERCDFLLSLPMLGKVTSLNASVAAGIFIYHALNQRKNAK